MIKRFARACGRRLAAYLNQPRRKYESFDISDPSRLAAVLRPADVLLVDGNARVSTAIKYLTQSTWSHAALFVGKYLEEGRAKDAAAVLIEADLVGGVIAVPLEKYARLNTRICRPVSLDSVECRQLCQYAIERLGHAYDLRNVFDLARYLLPVPPDFDISPFFQVVKPTLESGFDHRTLTWADTATGPDAGSVPAVAPVPESFRTTGGDDA